MKILTGEQIKNADRYTIENEPIASIELMERASQVIADWIGNNIDKKHPLLFLIGKGNNGGDGLAVARILYHAGYECSVHMVYSEGLSEDCQYNLNRLPEGIKKADAENISVNTILIDALLGTGVKGELREPLLSFILHINELPNLIISIDLPSGMMTEYGNTGKTIVKADITLTLEFPKLAMLLPEAGEYCGEINILPISLSREFIDNSPTPFCYITKDYIDSIRLKRTKFAHKGTYGHALLICGSKGMTGAAILATGAALRSGCGLVTLHIPEDERFAVQAVYPSAILSLDSNGVYFSELPADLSKYTSIGIGCGLENNRITTEAFRSLLEMASKPMVLDADALNILSEHYKLRYKIPPGSILTPHPGELKRLVGDWKNEEEKAELTKRLSASLQSIVVVKGAHTMVCMPDGTCYFNATGNSGMAKGGSGDVLTGYITGLLARGYSSKDAAILGVYMHGIAGDKAAATYGVESMNSRDLIDYLSNI